MKNKFLTYLYLGTILGCGGNIGIAPEKTTGSVDTSEETIETSDSSIVDTGEEQEQEQEQEEQDPENLEDFIYRGPHDVSTETGNLSVTDCNMNFTVYSPSIENPPVVILGHGFARGPGTMTGWADHLASWGVKVLLPTLCHYNILAGVDHEKNGLNMVELGQSYGANEVIYAGHSAGGLAAIIAASLDINNLGVLGLDATDTEGIPGVDDFIGQQYASSVTSTAFSVRGEPSSCNSDGNGLDLFEMMPNSYKAKVDEADHCDFEYPTNFGCEVNCENSQSTMSDEEIRSLIVVFGTSAILSLADISDDGWIIWLGR